MTCRIMPMIVVLAAWLLCGCTSVRYVPMEVVRTEYVEADTTAIYNRIMRMFETIREREARSDSLVDRSKETVILNDKGDTTRHERERIVYRSTNNEKELEHRVSTQDSIINALRLQLASVKTDSIPVPYPVERQLSRWERAKMDYGGVAMGATVAAIAVAVLWLIRKIRRKK